MSNKNILKGTKLGYIINLMLIGWVWVVLFGSWMLGTTYENQPPSGEAINLPVKYTFNTALNSSFSHVWTLDDVTINPLSKGEIRMVAQNNNLFILGQLKSYGRPYAILSLDADTASVNHSYIYYEAPYSARAKTIAINSNYLLVGFDGTQKISGNTTWGASKILAIELESGSVAWETAVPGARSLDSMNLCGETIGVRGSFSSNTYVLDANTGNILQKTPAGEEFTWFVEGKTAYQTSREASFSAYDLEGNTNLWSVSLTGAIYQPILCHDDVIVVRTISKAIYALDKVTGNIRWNWSNVTSNIDSNEEYAFFMAERTLTVVDLMSGNPVDEIIFSPDPVTSIDTANYPFHIAVDGEQIFVYFGDSYQIFAFQFIPPSTIP